MNMDVTPQLIMDMGHAFRRSKPVAGTYCTSPRSAARMTSIVPP